MATTSEPPVSFAEADDRSDAMRRTIDDWLRELAELVDEARASDEFKMWLDMQSRFHDYSAQNTLLIKQQCPDATKVAGFGTWQAEFDRYVEEGEQAIWIWAPIIARRCPECKDSRRYHEASDCEYDETPPEEWSKGLVGFKPAPVFDVSQTAGEPLPELETTANGDAGWLVDTLLEVTEDLEVEARIVNAGEWDYGEADGVCQHRETEPPLIEAKARENKTDLAATLIHEFAHAQLHGGSDDSAMQAKREVEAEAVAYVVGRYLGIDTDNSAFYLAAWAGEDQEVLQDRLQRISHTAQKIIDAVPHCEEPEAP